MIYELASSTEEEEDDEEELGKSVENSISIYYLLDFCEFQRRR